MRQSLAKPIAGMIMAAVVLLQATSWSAGKALFLATADNQPGSVLLNIDTLSLETAGELVRLQFDIRLDGVFGPDALLQEAFRFGFYNSNRTIVRSDDADAGAGDDDAGCFVSLACGEASPQAVLAIDGGQAVINGGTDVTVLGTAFAGRLNNLQSHTIVFVVGRTDDDQLYWDLQIDSAAVLDRCTQPAAAVPNQFNEIAFTAAAGVDLSLDNVQVLTNAAFGEASADCLSGYPSDFNQDCRVDLNDAIRLGSEWLLVYDLNDLLQLAADWLACDNLDLVHCF